jgi:hypothetical protein
MPVLLFSQRGSAGRSASHCCSSSNSGVSLATWGTPPFRAERGRRREPRVARAMIKGGRSIVAARLLSEDRVV